MDNDDHGTLCNICAAAVGVPSSMKIEGDFRPIVGSKSSCALCHRRLPEGIFMSFARGDVFNALAAGIETIGHRIVPIPVSERLPEDQSQVMAWCDAEQDWYRVRFDSHGGYWWDEHGDNCHLHREPTHWLPLPPKPE